MIKYPISPAVQEPDDWSSQSFSFLTGSSHINQEGKSPANSQNPSPANTPGHRGGR